MNEASAAANERMAIARVIIKEKWPYLTSLIYSLVPKELPGLGTLLTSEKLVMLYDPVWFASLTDEVAAGCLIHESFHVVRKHFMRGMYYPDLDLANKAGDLTINQDIREMEAELPDWALYPETFGFPLALSMEEYYELLAQLKGKDGPPKKGSVQISISASGPPQPGDQKPQDGQGEEQGDPPKGGKCCAGRCGGVAGNGEDIEKAIDEAEPDLGRTPEEMTLLEHTVARDIQNAVASEGRGKVPGSLVEWAEKVLEKPKIKWQQILPRIVRRTTGTVESGGNDYSKKRLSKRTHVRGLLIPGMIQEQPIIAFVRDTSGSMGRPQLRAAVRESCGALKSCGIENAWFLDADAAVTAVPRMLRIREIQKLPITGRGGTDFGPALERVQKLRPRPNVCIYLTDGDGNAPDLPPRGMEVIWVIIKSYYNKAPCDWGHHIFVDDV